MAPGEVPILPTEAPTEGVHEDLEEEATEERTVVYPEEQQVEYPLYESGGDQIQVQPVQYHRNQPGDPEVVVVDDTDLNVDGEFTGGRVKLCVSSAPLVFSVLFSLCFSMFSVFSYNLGTCTNNRNKCSQFADCKDYSSGYCCHCRPGFYGNGIQCVAEGNIISIVGRSTLV